MVDLIVAQRVMAGVRRQALDLVIDVPIRPLAHLEHPRGVDRLQRAHRAAVRVRHDPGVGIAPPGQMALLVVTVFLRGLPPIGPPMQHIKQRMIAGGPPPVAVQALENHQRQG